MKRQVFAVRSYYSEVFANLPSTPAALLDDVANDVAHHWFLSDELRSLNITQPADFFFVSELYMMKEIISAVCFVIYIILLALTLWNEHIL